MKRKDKNLISFLIIILLLLTVGLTLVIAKNKLSTTSNTNSFEMNNNSNINNVNNSEEPPEKPDGDTSSNSEQPPEKPDDDNNTQNSSQSNMIEPTNMTSAKSTTTSKLTTTYYVIIGVESLLISLIIIYLIQSKLNKKTFKETYCSFDKVIISILSTIILTSLLTIGIGYIMNNYILIKNTNTTNNMQGDINNNSNASYSAVNEITSSSNVSNKEYESTTEDENSLSISGDIEVTLDNITVNKTGDSSGGDNTSFYGINSAIISKDGATLNITNSNITTNATGANGVFSYGGSATTNNSNSDGTTVNISDSTIITKKDNSGGIMTTGGGITNASNLTITTSGTSSAAIRTDRGGGTVNVNKGTYKTTGQGSPSIYSTAEITVKDATLISTASEGIVIEGKNSVTIENVDLTDTNNKLNGQSTTYKNIFLYQSMSGDADDGESVFTAKNSTITTNKGDTLYVTNTTSKITLTNNTIINNDETGNFLRAQADSWGNSGSNGGNVTLILNNQEVTGNIVIDSISTLDMTLNQSNYTGTINKDNSAKNIKITLDKKSKIKLTGDSYITSLENEDTTNSNIDFNGYKLYVNGKLVE